MTRVLALSGGIGGAKLALGLARVLAPDDLVIVANTGDDFEHLGLHVAPDLDTLMYTLAGLDNPATGWGRRDESWAFMQEVERLGAPSWFRLGDRDLAVHVERTRRLRAGDTLSAITADFCRRLGVAPRLLPMSDDAVRTQVRCGDEWLAFQDWFVRLGWQPQVTAVRFDGASRARAHPAIIEALRSPDLTAVVFCPSNPFVSIDPILAVPGMREALRACCAPRIAVSPIVGGQAVKGPTAKMMRELGLAATPWAVAEHYAGLVDAMVIDEVDGASAGAHFARRNVTFTATRTVMQNLADREQLARDVLAFAERIRVSRPGTRCDARGTARNT